MDDSSDDGLCTEGGSAFGDEFPVSDMEDQALQSALDGIRYLYRACRYPTDPVGILCIFGKLPEQEVLGLVESIGATVALEASGLPGKTAVNICVQGKRCICKDAADGISVPTETDLRVRDILAEFLLRACYDHVARKHAGTDHGSRHLLFIISKMGGRWLGDSAVARMVPGNLGDLVQVGMMLRALDVIDRKVDDDRVLKAYVEHKGKPRRTLELERKTRFREMFAEVEFDPDVTEDDERGMWLCLQDLIAEDLIPDTGFLKDVCLKVRKIPDLGGQYSDLSKMLIIREYGTFVHEYAHALDYARGSLSHKEEFATALISYRMVFDWNVRNMEDRSRNGYFRSPEECFARCFEMYVMRHHGPCKLLRPYYPEWAYPKSGVLNGFVDRYFDALCGRKSRARRLSASRPASSPCPSSPP